MKAVLFDLDDTLYPEIEFVRSGFAVVSRHLAKRFRINEQELLERLISILKENGRGKIFDTVLEDLGQHSQEDVKLLIYLYRSHNPVIHPYPDVIPVLKELKKEGFKLGILTDGMASVQRNKIRALDISGLFDVIMCTDELGSENWKPSLLPFRISLNLLEVSPQDSCYVGNDIGKDFIAPNKQGMQTIRIDRQQIGTKQTNSDLFEAKFVVSNLDDILDIVRK